MILAASAFTAGVLMFLAPCTLPLVPAYLAFISGVREDDVQDSTSVKRKVVVNAVAFVLGFSLLFILFGVLAGFFGAFVGQYRVVLSQIGGVFIIVFGLMMLNVVSITPLLRKRKIALPAVITPGKPTSAFLIGSIFALGWTPCVGPVLASVLLIATTKATVFSGAFLLSMFSLGLAVPFIATALLYTRAGKLIKKYSYLSRSISMIGGLFLILIGVLLLFNNFGLTVQYGYQFTEFLGIGNLLKYY